MSAAALLRISWVVGWLCIFDGTGTADPIPVRYPEGSLHAFVELQTLDGKTIGGGEYIQSVRREEVTTREVLYFLDGSQYDETTVFLQNRTFRMLRDHVVQRGPSFREQMEATIDAVRNEVTVRSKEKDGTWKTRTEQLNIPTDAANGLLTIILKDIEPGKPETIVSYVATTPKARLVKMRIDPGGQETFGIGPLVKKASSFDIKIELGGVEGVVAPLIGKKPPDVHAWVVEEGTPAVIRVEAPLEAEGPVWRLESAPPPLARPAHPAEHFRRGAARGG